MSSVTQIVVESFIFIDVTPDYAGLGKTWQPGVVCGFLQVYFPISSSHLLPASVSG